MNAAQSYAQALYAAATERNREGDVVRDLQALSPIMQEHKHFFLNPSVSTAEQVDVLGACLDGRADALTAEFLALLAQRRCLGALPAIAAHMEELHREATGSVTVRLRMPFLPGEALLSELRRTLCDSMLFPSGQSDKVRFEVEIDPGLIGGFTAECGGRVLDMSLKTRLSRMAN